MAPSLSNLARSKRIAWGLQHRAHEHARSLPPIPTGVRPETSLDSVRKKAADSALDAWATQARNPDYLGHQFMVLRDSKGKPERPTYSNGGVWLRHTNESNVLTARMCRAILNHAPTGEYYSRFRISGHDDHECECGCLVQTRHHIFTQCGVLQTYDRDPHYVRELVWFLEDNPKAFAFGFEYAPQGDG